ncbi:MAG: hypothetical protein RL660_2715 [Bacteroidota bacterium]|jgi:oligoendopeptidase F
MRYFRSMSFNANIQKIVRQFIPADYTVSDWDSLKPYFDQLQNADISTLPQLEQWLLQVSELQSVISEDVCWRQIKMTCDTANKTYEEAYNYWCTDLQGPIAIASNDLNNKLIASAAVDQLDKEKYGIYLRGVKNAVDLFREANVPLQSEESVLAQQYGQIAGAMSVDINGTTYTMPQASKFLQQADRSLRQQAYNAITERRAQDKDELNELFDKLLNLRAQIAKNAGFDNYRDYKFRELGRFDYSVADCEAFHTAVQKHIVPLVKKIYQHKQKQLALDSLKPYDVDAVAPGEKPLTPFIDGKDLGEKSIAVFDKMGQFFGDCLRKMQAMQHLDLDSRAGKAPGGYNCPLAETGVPFIFMNAASTADDVITMMHEGGHAIHSFVCHDLALSSFKEYPMEIAELASMSMELMSMDHWQTFYDNPNDLAKAKALELDRAITVLPWIAIIDKFQHWLYTNIGHSVEQREEAWLSILAEYDTGCIDHSDYHEFRKLSWQKQLHLYEVPFYYIEYGIAQLGAIAMWRQYKQNAKGAVDNYLKALSLGNTKNLRELYSTAGISFDFSDSAVQTLGSFVDEEMQKVMH